jgi:hypothetical protein
MSIVPSGIATGASATPLAQPAAGQSQQADTAAGAARRAEAVQRAELAEGVGETEEKTDTQDRDADGRRPWERPQRRAPNSNPVQPAEEAASTEPPRAPDPTGQSGQLLDLCG